MTHRLTRLLRRLGIRAYPSWPAMPDGPLVFFLAITSLLSSLIVLFFAMAHPDIITLARAVNGPAHLAMSWRDRLLVSLVGSVLLAFGALWLWATWVSAVCFKILVDRHAGSPPPAAAA